QVATRKSLLNDQLGFSQPKILRAFKKKIVDNNCRNKAKSFHYLFFLTTNRQYVDGYEYKIWGTSHASVAKYLFSCVYEIFANVGWTTLRIFHSSVYDGGNVPLFREMECAYNKSIA